MLHKCIRQLGCKTRPDSTLMFCSSMITSGRTTWVLGRPNDTCSNITRYKYLTSLNPIGGKRRSLSNLARQGSELSLLCCNGIRQRDRWTCSPGQRDRTITNASQLTWDQTSSELIDLTSSDLAPTNQTKTPIILHYPV